MTPQTATAERDSMQDWQLEPPLNFRLGETYIVRANHVSGRFWADLLIEITEYYPESGVWKIELRTVLDGSPGLVAGFDGRDGD